MKVKMIFDSKNERIRSSYRNLRVLRMLSEPLNPPAPQKYQAKKLEKTKKKKTPEFESQHTTAPLPLPRPWLGN